MSSFLDQINTLTLGEVGFIERHSHVPIHQIGEALEGKESIIPLLEALVKVAKTRSGDPTFTIDDARKLTVDEAMNLLGISEEQPS